MNLKQLKYHKQLFVTLSVIILSGIFILLIFIQKESSKNSIIRSDDLINHSFYSNYNFIKNDSVINIGIQPLYIPTGIFFEVIKRDNILNNTLLNSGKKIEYYSFFKGADVNYFLQQKLLDAGVGGDMPALSVSSVFDVIIPIIIQKGNASIVSNKPMLSKDLRGKHIAFPYGSISHYFVLNLLQSAKISENMVHLHPMDLSDMTEALYKNEIDLFSAWEPTVTTAIKKYPEFFIPYRKLTTGYLYFLKEFVRINPEITNHILAAVIRSIRWIKSNKDNLYIASKWNISEIERITGIECILNPEDLSTLAMDDLLGYYSKYSVVISPDEISKKGSLYREYEFLRSLNNTNEMKIWEEIVECFDRNLIYSILDHPEEFRLNTFDYTVQN